MNDRRGVVFGIIALLVGTLGSAQAGIVTVFDGDFSVDAQLHTNTEPLDTRVDILAGDVLNFFSSTEDVWNMRDVEDQAPMYTNADGLADSPITNDGFTFYAGTMIGEIGDDGFFAIGTSLSMVSPVSGKLYLLNWDQAEGGEMEDKYWNNTGSILVHLKVQRQEPVPEPATILLFGTGVAALVRAQKRKRT